MTHELRELLRVSLQNREKGITNVLASVVALDGSSYRKPGVRMLISEDGTMTGAVSGGCVEKEVLLQAGYVFEHNKPLIMAYDGRYRLGCEGILYILIEPFTVSGELEKLFENHFRERKEFWLHSFYRQQEGMFSGAGSVVEFEDGSRFSFLDTVIEEQPGFSVFTQGMKPLFKLLIIGCEHDAVQMCAAASFLGWEVNVIASPRDPRTKESFPGAEELHHMNPEEVKGFAIDRQTAVILMNHSYAKDLQFLLALKEKDPVYIGLLGSAKRREKLFHELIELHPEINDRFLDKIHGPAGLDIGAVTPQEIAVSITSEILTVIRDKEAFPLRQKQGRIHN